MAAFDFPSTPSVGDLFQDGTSGAVYRWNGYAWVGGVTGIGLQTIKETRWLTGGSFTHVRDPKSNGFADLFVLGAQGGRPAVSNASNICIAGGGGTGAYTIKWKYPLGPSCAVVVGNGVSGLAGQASSFDGGITAVGGNPGGSTTVVPTANGAAGGGLGGAAGATGDENYAGISGASAVYIASYGGIICPFVWANARDVIRYAAQGAVLTSTIAAVAGSPGFVVVREYLNP